MVLIWISIVSFKYSDVHNASSEQLHEGTQLSSPTKGDNSALSVIVLSKPLGSAAARHSMDTCIVGFAH